MKTAPRTMPLTLKDDLEVAAFKRRTTHFLIDNLKKNRVVNTTQLLKRYGKERLQNFFAFQLVDGVQRGYYPISVMGRPLAM